MSEVTKKICKERERPSWNLWFDECENTVKEQNEQRLRA